MARPANKPAAEHQPRTPDVFTLPAPIADPTQEIMYLLGHARGRIATADRITELFLTLQAQWAAKVTEALENGRAGH